MMTGSPEIVITGVGLITALGASAEETWRAVRDGRSGMGQMPALEQRPAGGDKPGGNGGQAPDLPSNWMPGQAREVRYLRKAIDEALEQAGLSHPWPHEPARCGCVLGTTLHGMRQGGEFLRTGNVEPLCSFLATHTMSLSLRGLPIEGLTTTTCSACSSALGAIALGVSLLRAGQLDLVIAGGYDPVSEYAYAGFDSMRLVASGSLRPFCKDRDGMKLAEGYAIVVLERAPGRNRTLAAIRGVGESADGHHLTQPHPEGEGALRAIEQALADTDRASIGLISAHATATPNNDAAEYRAFSRAFGDRLSSIPAVGFKSHIGHTLGAAGATELILSMLAMREGTVPPTAGITRAELEFPDMAVTELAIRQPISATLNVSLGFGGANACIVLDRSARTGTTRSTSRDVFITGVGFLAPGMIGNEAFARRLSDGATEASPPGGMLEEGDYAHLINARRVRRMSDYSKMTLAATTLALQHAGIEDIASFAESCAAILGSTHGGATFCRDYYAPIVREGMVAANPVLFAEGVPNAASAQLSLMLGVKGACQTIIGSRTAGLDALRLAAIRIARGEWDRAIVSAAEEDTQTLNDAYRHAGLIATDPSRPFEGARGFRTSSGAVTLILESESSRGTRRPLGRIGRTSSATGPARARLDGRVSRVIADIGAPLQIACSANGTWIDAAEAKGLNHAGERNERGQLHVSALGCLACEMFSVGPLAAIAGLLLTRNAWGLTHGPDGFGSRLSFNPQPLADRVGIIACDYSGGVSAAEIIA